MGQDVPNDRDAVGGWGRAPASPQRATASAQFFQARPAPSIHIAGKVDHPDFRDALNLLRSTANVAEIATVLPEVIIIAQSRPGTFSIREVEALRRVAPLAGIVSLAGTWCEGEPRTGRPWPGVQRLYWYEFPAWWQRQLALRAAGECPDWARPDNSELRISDHPAGGARGFRIDSAALRGTIVVDSPVRETADVLSDVLCRAGYTTVWQRGNRSRNRFRGAIAGVWDGGQLSDREANELSNFCRLLSADGAPVVALLDFPRREGVDQAVAVGAAAVIGKPWLNSNLIATLQMAAAIPRPRRAA